MLHRILTVVYHIWDHLLTDFFHRPLL